MILCLDAGNTRLKWGVSAQTGDAPRWMETDACEHADIARLAEVLARYPEIASIWLSNVAGETVERAVRSALGPWEKKLKCARSEAFSCGVQNGYAQPEKLGVDRWCALIAAWQEQGRASLVVSLGTATTVDALDDEGRFLGGMILPGLTLMRQSLAQRTAQLPAVSEAGLSDEWVWPNSTDAAIQTGAQRATLGAVEQAWQRLAQTASAPPVCVLTGGAAEQIQVGLSIPHCVVPHAVLNGLRLLAQSAE